MTRLVDLGINPDEECPEHIPKCSILMNIPEVFFVRKWGVIVLYKFHEAEPMICKRTQLFGRSTKALCFLEKTDSKIIYSIYVDFIHETEPPHFIVYGFDPICASCSREGDRCSCAEWDAYFEIKCSKEAYESVSLLSDAFRILSLHKQLICMNKLIEKFISLNRLKVDAQPLDYIMFEPLFI